jgi:3-hydroxyisobutyrate dehydrogenase-like beta-hydroxyacid dehydrogenase
MAKVAFCGLGSMGAPMALRLVDAGHDVTVWNRTSRKAAPLVERGATLAGSPAEAAAGAEAAITMVADPAALKRVVLGPDGLAEGLAPGASFIEMSTIGPSAVDVARTWIPEEVEMLDAPVLGSVKEATEGTLRIFVGGSKEAFERWVPLLEGMGSPRHLGSQGAGAAMKLVVNSTLMALMTALAEALALGDALALEQSVVLDVLADSPIGVPARSKRQRIETGKYPANFRVALAAKDAALILEEARRAGLDLPVAASAGAHMEAAQAAGLGDLDYSAVVAHVRGNPASLP